MISLGYWQSMAAINSIPPADGCGEGRIERGAERKVGGGRVRCRCCCRGKKLDLTIQRLSAKCEHVGYSNFGFSNIMSCVFEIMIMMMSVQYVCARFCLHRREATLKLLVCQLNQCCLRLAGRRFYCCRLRPR